MAISACLIAALLAVPGTLTDSVSGVSSSGIESREHVTVVIRREEDEPEPSLAMDRPADPALPQEPAVPSEHADASQHLVARTPSLVSAEVKPLTDWHAIAQEAARASVDGSLRDEASRAAMWRQSRSMMFQPAKNSDAVQEDPAIPNFRFKPEIHVVGLGFTIGSCFFGVPVAGVPVEQRTVPMSFLVCARDSG
jgi:hypothetical protein